MRGIVARRLRKASREDPRQVYRLLKRLWNRKSHLERTPEKSSR